MLLDSDLVGFYGTTTSGLNQAIKRNSEQFPEDFAFQLTAAEIDSLQSRNVIAKSEREGRRSQPWAFYGTGGSMLSSVRKPPTAARVNVEITRAFIQLCKLMATPGDLVEQLTSLANTVQWYDNQIKVIHQVLQPLLEKPRGESKRSNASSRCSPSFSGVTHHAMGRLSTE